MSPTVTCLHAALAPPLSVRSESLRLYIPEVSGWRWVGGSSGDKDAFCLDEQPVSARSILQLGKNVSCKYYWLLLSVGWLDLSPGKAGGLGDHIRGLSSPKVFSSWHPAEGCSPQPNLRSVGESRRLHFSLCLPQFTLIVGHRGLLGTFAACRNGVSRIAINLLYVEVPIYCYVLRHPDLQFQLLICSSWKSVWMGLTALLSRTMNFKLETSTPSDCSACKITTYHCFRNIANLSAKPFTRWYASDCHSHVNRFEFCSCVWWWADPMMIHFP